MISVPNCDKHYDFSNLRGAPQFPRRTDFYRAVICYESETGVVQGSVIAQERKAAFRGSRCLAINT